MEVGIIICQLCRLFYRLTLQSWIHVAARKTAAQSYKAVYTGYGHNYVKLFGGLEKNTYDWLGWHRWFVFMISTVIFNSENLGTTREIEENIHVRDSWEGR